MLIFLDPLMDEFTLMEVLHGHYRENLSNHELLALNGVERRVLLKMIWGTL